MINANSFFSIWCLLVLHRGRTNPGRPLIIDKSQAWFERDDFSVLQKISQTTPIRNCTTLFYPLFGIGDHQT